MGYRHYDTHGIDPRWCFGHGLSYTSFAYAELTVTAPDDDARCGVACRSTSRTPAPAPAARSSRSTCDPSTHPVARPDRELKAFEKVSLDARRDHHGHRRARPAARSPIGTSDRHAWHAPAGTYEILVGSSSRTIHQSTAWTLTDAVTLPDPRTVDRGRDLGWSAGLAGSSGELSAVGTSGGDDAGVGVAFESPAAVVDEGVVSSAEEAAVVEVGGAVVFFPGLEVVGVAPFGFAVTAREPAAAVPDGQGPALAGGEAAVGPADVEDLAGVGVADDAADPAVAQQWSRPTPAGRGCRRACSGGGGTGRPAVSSSLKGARRSSRVGSVLGWWGRRPVAAGWRSR